MGAFQQLFKSIQMKQSGKVAVEAIPPGQPFPLEFAGTTNDVNLALFISLTCRECVYLLSDLPSFLSGFAGGVRMFVKGKEEEIRQLTDYYEFDFPVYPIREDEMTDLYKVPSTPYLYVADKSGIVSGSGNVHSVEELTELIKTLSPQK
ncbi:TlpA family protein disulfide reductase [Cohnella suwonensis]|uniref:TlpA family protein disulfide reductase n=1 Tax=Cohnella suwonensis TaxID=696072 RepID=A0ABW0M3E5_9BACL